MKESKVVLSVLQAVQVFTRSYDEMLDGACLVLKSLGWEPRDCLIENHPDQRRVLKVNGEAVFEVAVQQPDLTARNSNQYITITGRWLSVPPVKPSGVPYR